MGREQPARRRLTAVLGAGLLAVGTLISLTPPAAADTAPADPSTPVTVSADSLPTVQINGVVWAQVIVGNRVYATGQFSQARPAGAAAGTNQTARSNVLSFDLTTGALITSWAPSLNAQGLAIAASPDGSRIYVGGEFTQANGTTRNRVVALDATTGAVVSSFAGGTNGRVRAMAVTDTTVYVGGNFTQAGGQARSRLAAFSTANGALLPWAPTAEQEVFAMTAPPGSGKIVVGGRFTQLNGTPWYGMGALDAGSGAVVPWAATSVVRSAGPDAAIYHLTSDASSVYGVGYVFGPGGNFEGSFGAASADGVLRWIVGCLGDSYGVAAAGPVVYTVGHPHNCAQIGSFPEQSPRTWQRAIATTITPAADGRSNVGGPFNGRPAPEMLHWLPTMQAGSYTGQGQGAWTVGANSDYVVLGGEFPTINGVGQQGLTRFALRPIAPNVQGPQGSTQLATAAQAIAGTGVRVSWTAAWDRDNRRLTYELLRGATVGTSTVVGRVVNDAGWWERLPMALVDTSAPPGSSQTYRVRVIDPLGNTVVGSTVTATPPAASAAASTYRTAVRADGATTVWRLGEPSGSSLNLQGADDLVVTPSLRSQPGAIGGDPNAAMTFAGGNSGVPGTTQTVRKGPQLFSVEAWVRTTTGQGGKIIGYGNSATGTSTAYDRHVYMTNGGQITFGTNPGAIRTVTSPGSYNNGAWHHVVGTLGPDGMRLHVDGQLVAQRADTTRAQDMNGVWRVGGDNLASWPGAPTNRNLAGSLDEVATYPLPLTPQQIQAHWQLGTGQVPNQPPMASFTAGPTGLTAAFDGSASTDPDGTITGYGWNFGDGQTGTGSTTNHTYAVTGSYQATLTVTDDDGAPASTSRTVTVTDGQAPFAVDTFERTVVSGLGTADTGGPWTTVGSTADFAVNGGSGRIRLPAAAAQRSGSLGAVSQTAADVTAAVSLDRAQTGGGTYVSVIGRRVGNDDYRVQLRYAAGGAVTAKLARIVAGTETTIGTTTTVPGVTYAPGEVLRIRLQVTGNGPTTLTAKVWRQGAVEPAAWLVSGTDSTAVLQAPGAVGLLAYLSGSSAADAPMTASFEEFRADPQAP